MSWLNFVNGIERVAVLTGFAENASAFFDDVAPLFCALRNRRTEVLKEFAEFPERGAGQRTHIKADAAARRLYQLGLAHLLSSHIRSLVWFARSDGTERVPPVKTNS